MADETLRRNLDRAFDPGPDFPNRLLLSRTMAMVDVDAAARDRDGRTRSREQLWKGWPRPAIRLGAISMAAIVAVAATAALVVGVHVWRERNATVPVNGPHAAPGNSLLPVLSSWFFSADDAAVEPNVPGNSMEPGVLITHDGGRTWLPTTVNFPQVDLRWLDSQHIVAVVNNTGPPWLVETTADGGTHWQSTVAVPTVPAPGWVAPEAGWTNLGFPFFLNSREGWALCTADATCTVCNWDDNACLASQQQNSLYHTVDSGAHWQLLGKSFPLAPGKPWGLLFVDPNRGFIGANNADGVGRLFVTTDGGTTWRLVELPSPLGGSPPGANIVDLPAMFGKQGVLLDEDGAGRWFTYTTRDSGLTWVDPHLVPARELQNFYPSLGVRDPNSWWMVDGVGGLYGTTDGGRTWQQLQPKLPSGYTLDSVTPVGGNVLWGTARGGGSGQILYYTFPIRSTDGGATWSIVKLPAAGK
jgi:photosystem II stability/assembly factor-like uncharacterized protein